MKKIAFIGLGHMGMPMAKNLIAKGYSLAVFDINTAAVAQLEAAGAIGYKNALEAALVSDVVISMLPSGVQVASVYLGTEGLINNVSKPTIFLECSTIDISTCRQLHIQAVEKGHRLLDAPVSGGVSGATNGTLTFMVGGNSDLLAQVNPIFEAMGKNVLHAGDATHGQAAKICNNLMLAIHMIGTSEAFNLAEQIGLSHDKLFAIARVSSGQSWTLVNYCPAPGVVPTSPANNDYLPGFAAAMMLKDLRLALDAASKAPISLPLTKQSENVYSDMCKTHPNLDFSAVIKFLQSK